MAGSSAGFGRRASRRAVAASSSGRASGRAIASGSGLTDDRLPSASSRTSGVAAPGSIESRVSSLMLFPSRRGDYPRFCLAGASERISDHWYGSLGTATDTVETTPPTAQVSDRRFDSG